MIAEHKISNREYENDWLDDGCAVFKKQSLQETEWLPDQIFQGDRVFRFMLPYEYFRESVYDVVTKALRERGEDEFVIVPAGSSQSKISYVLRYATTDSYQEYLLHIDEPGFFLGDQPLEFCMHGRYPDWGIAASEPYNIAILGVHDEKRARAFSPVFKDDDEEMEAYLQTTPPDFRRRFESCYLREE
jgi:hypothetical protein